MARRTENGVPVKKVTDGLTKTILYGERRHEDKRFDELYKGPPAYPIIGWSGWAWTKTDNSLGDYTGHAVRQINQQLLPTDSGNELRDQRLCMWGSFHTGGANFCLADGAVTFFNDEMALNVLQALSTYNKAEVVEVPN